MTTGASPLRLYTPDADDEPTLCSFFAEHFSSAMTREMEPPRKPGTVASYRESMAWWARLTGDPPIRSITRELLVDFKIRLREQPGRAAETLSLETVDKHLKQALAVLRGAGPADDRRPWALSLVASVPTVARPAKPKRLPTGGFTVRELHQIYEAVGALCRPPRKGERRRQLTRPSLEGVRPSDWWRAIAVAAFHTGLRRETLLALRWEWLSTLDAEAADACGCPAQFTIPGEALKTGDPHVCLIDRETLDHLDSIRGDRQVVFQWTGAESAVDRWLTWILRRALPAERVKRLKKWHAFRASHATEMAVRNPAAASGSLGHKTPSLLMSHYANNQRVIGQTLADLPSSRGSSAADERQLELF